MPKLAINQPRSQQRERSFGYQALPVGALVVAFALVAYYAVDPPCPRRLVIATGSSQGAYYAFAQQYARCLARDGITLEVRETAGSVENLALLSDADSEVSLALVQGGAERPEDRRHATSLASLYLEPLWVFYRGKRPITRLAGLAGATIAVGQPGSGTRSLAEKLLHDVGLLSESSGFKPVAPIAWGGRQAAAALREGRIDAAFFVASSQSAMVGELLRADGIQVLSFRRADAFLPHHRFLSKVELPAGVLDLEHHLPEERLTLLAPNANLVARSDLHSALVPLLLKAAAKVHGPGGVLERPGQFPSPNHLCLPLHASAERYFKSGPSLLYRVLPFQTAALIDRMKFMLLPLVTLLLPLLKAVPPVYRWRIRSKIYRWYRVLRDVDHKLKTADAQAELQVDIARLEELEHELAEVSVPLSYMEEFYNLRLHVAFMLGRLRQREASEPQTVRKAA